MKPVTSRVHVRVPATSANLGSGFDAVGLALGYFDDLDFTLIDDAAIGDAGFAGTAGTTSTAGTSGTAESDPSSPLVAEKSHSQNSYGTFQPASAHGAHGSHSPDGASNPYDSRSSYNSYTPHSPHNPRVEVEIEGEGANTLPRDASHLVIAAFHRACATFGLGTPSVRLQAVNRIPQARGMGSSAEAIVAGITAAAAFAYGNNWNRDTVFDLAAAMEGHPDNVAPAVYGGMTVSWRTELPEGTGSLYVDGGSAVTPGFHTVNYPVAADLMASVFIPDFELSTAKARAALPKQVALSDAIFNLSRVGLLPAALGGNAPQANSLLISATQDSLHQPYRAELMQPSTDLIALLRSNGFAAAVSGAGPCVIVLHHGDASETINRVATNQLRSGHWQVLHLPVDVRGVQVSF